MALLQGFPVVVLTVTTLAACAATKGSAAISPRAKLLNPFHTKRLSMMSPCIYVVQLRSRLIRPGIARGAMLAIVAAPLQQLKREIHHRYIAHPARDHAEYNSTRTRTGRKGCRSPSVCDVFGVRACAVILLVVPTVFIYVIARRSCRPLIHGDCKSSGERFVSTYTLPCWRQ